jgi:signal transduction histidine kinase
VDEKGRAATRLAAGGDRAPVALDNAFHNGKTEAHPALAREGKDALGRETGRIQRFTEQMIFLSQPPGLAADLVPIAALLEESCAHAAHVLGTSARLMIEGETDGAFVRAHRPGLAHAFEEIFLNGLQAAPGSALRVRFATEHPADGGGKRLVLRFHDAGPGFTPDVAARAHEPFFTTRSTGVGLGLTVARRVVEQHAGRLEVRARTASDDTDILLELPLP